MNPDLATERELASFSTDAMIHLLDHDLTGARTRAKARVRQLIPTNEAPFDKSEILFMSRRERFAYSLRLHRAIYDLVQRHHLSDEERAWITEDVDSIPTSTHDLIFAGGIKALGDDAQQAYWLPRCSSYEVLGAYAQTELGHGSNIRKLETTATYDPATREFELHSPTLTSTKWWPGTLGACATHALVFAMLRIGHTQLGMHAFVVPVRDPATHKPLPGIAVGDIGPKLGMNNVDNGFLRMERVRVPREAMLSRHAQVEPDGRYVRPQNPQANYGTMLLARVSYVHSAYISCAAAATIAVRYAAVRRQGGDGEVEMKLLDWTAHQRRLLPVLALAYSLHYCGVSLRAKHARLLAGDYSELGSLHVAIAGTKVMVTDLTSRGMEVCRQLCGGHGYSLSSGIPERWATFTHTTTAEGDNTVMTLQVSKALLKLVGNQQSALPYLSDPDATLGERCPAASAADWTRPPVYLHALRHRACRLAAELATSQARRRKAGTGASAAWNADLNLAKCAGRAHAELLMVELFVSGLTEQLAAGGAETLGPVLRRLCALFALDLVEAALADLYEDGYLGRGAGAQIREAIEAELTALRPDALPLVDAFNMSDYQLHSCIGRHDGQVYDALWEHAQRATAYLCESGPDGRVDGWREGIAPGTAPDELARRTSAGHSRL